MEWLLLIAFACFPFAFIAWLEWRWSALERRYSDKVDVLIEKAKRGGR